MGVTIRKLFWVWNFDKEEAWLQDMAEKGLHLTGVRFGSYTFEQGMPGAYNVRLEMFKRWPTHPESEQYIQFIEETGAEYLGSIGTWVYFRKRTDDGPFDLFSDIDSRIMHLNRILLLIGVVGINPFIQLVNRFGHLFIPASPTILEATNVAIFALLVLLNILYVYGFICLLRKRQALKKMRALHE